MRGADQVADFVRAALERGHPRSDIAEVLQKAGWSPTEVTTALGAWAEGAFQPPVPRPRSFVSAREAFQYAVLFTALAMVCWNVTTLGFELIDRYLPGIPPDEYATYSDWAIRWAIAILVVALPIFLVLNRHMGRLLQAEPYRRRSALRKWFGYVTLFLAAFALAGDLVSVIYNFLNGDLTLNVALKAALVAVTAGLVYWYFHLQMQESSREG